MQGDPLKNPSGKHGFHNAHSSTLLVKVQLPAKFPKGGSFEQNSKCDICIGAVDEDLSDEPIIVVNWDALDDLLQNFWESLKQVKIDINPCDNK